VCEFGDFRVKENTVGAFEGNGENWYGTSNEQEKQEAPAGDFFDRLRSGYKKVKSIVKETKKVIQHHAKRRYDPNESAVDSRDVKLYHLADELKSGSGFVMGTQGEESVQKRLTAEIAHRDRTDAIFTSVFP
jgi:hypothetical protein